MNFAALIPDSAITQAIGDDVTYQSAGGPVAIKALFDLYTNPVSAFDTHITESRKRLDVAIADMPGVQKGSVFTVNGNNYTVNDIINNDGQFATLVLR